MIVRHYSTTLPSQTYLIVGVCFAGAVMTPAFLRSKCPARVLSLACHLHLKPTKEPAFPASASESAVFSRGNEFRAKSPLATLCDSPYTPLIRRGVPLVRPAFVRLQRDEGS